jgi:hypothetical protein
VVAAERAKFAAKTLRLLRLTAAGAGTSSFTFDCALLWDKVNPYQNANGDTRVKLDGTVHYSSADSLSAKMVLLNSMSALP